MTEQEKDAAEHLHELVRKGRSSPVYFSGTGKALALTPDGIALVENLAGHKKNQNYIAAKLGITKSQFKRLLEDKDSNNPTRLAWERGFAEHEDHIRKLLLKHAQKNVIGAIFYSKVQLGWKENEPVVQVHDDKRIQITLPAPMEFGDMLKALGQNETLDFRKDRKVPLHEVLATSPIIGNDGEPFYEALPPPSPRVCSATEIIHLKATGQYDPKIHLTEGGPNE